MSRLETPGILKTKIIAQMRFELSRLLGYISLFSPATEPLWAVSWTSYSRT